MQGYASSNHVKGRKLHLLVDTLGLVLTVAVAAASAADPARAGLLFRWMGGACKKLRKIWVDGTYRGKLVDWIADYCRVLLQSVVCADDQKRFVVLP